MVRGKKRFLHMEGKINEEENGNEEEIDASKPEMRFKKEYKKNHLW